MDAVAVLNECKELSRQGKITFPEVVRRLSEAGIERYHVDLTRDETTYYLSNGESHVVAMHGPQNEITRQFNAEAVEQAVRASQRGEIIHPEFLTRIRSAGCVGYFAQLSGRQVQYIGRSGEMHVEPFPVAKA